MMPKGFGLLASITFLLGLSYEPEANPVRTFVTRKGEYYAYPLVKSLPSSTLAFDAMSLIRDSLMGNALKCADFKAISFHSFIVQSVLLESLIYSDSVIHCRIRLWRYPPLNHQNQRKRRIL